MKIRNFAAVAVLAVSLTGCSTLTNAVSAPSASAPAELKASLPASCQNAALLKKLTGFEAWDKTEPADQGKKLNCMYGFPNSDVGFTIDYTLSTADAWATLRKKAIAAGWIADTLTSDNLSTVYQDLPDEGLGAGVEVKVFDHGVVFDYNLWSGQYDRKDPAIVDGLAAIPVK